MLNNDFFELRSLEVTEDCKTAKAEVKLNPKHKIFEGHFPDLPVVPGVCTIQMIKEILSEILKTDLMLVFSNSVKLHNPINPLFNDTLTFSIQINSEQENLVHADTEVFFENIKFCSFRGDFKIV